LRLRETYTMPSIRGRLIYEILRLQGSPFDRATPLETQRADLERQARHARVPGEVQVQATSIGPIYAEWLRPRNAASNAALLYLHGGGYTMGSCNTHRALAARIASAANVDALLIDYRLAPEHPYPAALADARNAYGWLMQRGLDADKVVVGGDSAGGGLAVALAVGLRDQAQPLPGALICLSPWLDLTMSGQTMKTVAQADPLITWESSVLHARRYVRDHHPKEPLISPVFANPAGLPAIYVQVGEHEVLRSDSERFVRAARQAGIHVRFEIWPGMWHVWHAWAPWVPEAGHAIRLIGDFIREKLGTSKV
jgi:monoterpene epsilon-lactone hydrolase